MSVQAPSPVPTVGWWARHQWWAAPANKATDLQTSLVVNRPKLDSSGKMPKKAFYCSRQSVLTVNVQTCKWDQIPPNAMA